MTTLQPDDSDTWLAIIAGLIEQRSLLIRYLSLIERQLIDYGALKPQDRAVLSRRERRATPIEQTFANMPIDSV